jgi:uncharacterized protein (TIGR03382 family)
VQHTCNFGLGSQVEDLVWTWVGFQDVDPGPRLPQTNETYYVRVVMGGLGCSGAWVHPELKLPNGTALAITAQTPIRCFVDRPNQPPHQPLGSDCPTSPATGIYPGGSGFLAFYPTNGQGYWPLPLGWTLYIEVPVRSSTTLSGIATNDYAVAAVNILDNNPGGGNPPWDNPNPPSSGPWQGVFVTSAAAQPSPYVSYSDVAATAATTTATTDFVVHNVGCALSGSALQGDLLPVVPPDGTETFAGATCIAGCCSGTCATTDTVTYRFSWTGLAPDTEYKWRGYFNPLVVASGCARDVADAQTNAGAPQFAFFKTPPTTPPPAMYSLLLHASAGGTLAATPAPPSGSVRYTPGTVVTVTAQPEAGFMLDKLTVDGATASSPATITMSADRAVEATFVMMPSSGGDAGIPDGGNPMGGGCCDTSGTAGTVPLCALVLLALSRRRRVTV